MSNEDFEKAIQDCQTHSIGLVKRTSEGLQYIPYQQIYKGQTRLGSFIESWINIFVGFGIAFIANLLILPAFGLIGLTAKNNFAITCIFTVISFVRSFILRRLFNRIKAKWNHHA